MNPILSIWILLLTVLIAGAVFFVLNKKEKQQRKAETQDQVTAQEFTNVKDVRDKYLYTRDHFIFQYLKIDPVSIDLLSQREKESLTRRLTAELSGDQETIKLIAVSRPVDISPLINEYTDLLGSTTNQKQKELLRKEISSLSNYALSGEVIERQFYLPIWQKYEPDCEQDISRRVNSLKTAFETCKVPCSILREKDIVRLCNLVNNPAHVHIEDSNVEPVVPILTG
ncbi:hypothetical protein [Desulfitobacterium chlororespirans]|uniref:Uncharacterized protein n=1 Tax=Desulfitobacterium chlororespirans DSM 11544 TaxID=1121395 RepID=A0A1M7UXZ0_9FIRM|nr:hypothetical protein [Desulfitobacterium chlororespirans]SHN87901.1 hypothetical protein SAMN02745215_05018 [Desulfitobacterium chlororespirans DSM 11544]